MNNAARMDLADPLTVVEYGDFECSVCRAAEPAVRMMLSRFHGSVQLVYRHYPIEGAHPHALMVAEAAEGAAAQGRYWLMHDRLMHAEARLDRRARGSTVGPGSALR